MLVAWISIVLFFSKIGFTNSVDFTWIKDIPIKADIMYTDHLGNIYTVNHNTLSLVQSVQKVSINYSNNLFGKIHSVDVTDPLRILVFYKGFNTVTVLNNSLTELRSAINLSDLGFNNVLAVGTASKGGFWIYENDLGQLIYIDRNLKPSQKSAVLFDLIENRSQLEFYQIIEKGDNVYLGIAGQGIFQFNSYGNYVKSFPINDFIDFQVAGNHIIYFNNQELKFYNMQSYETENCKLPVEKIKNIKVEGAEIFLLLEDRISIYSINY